MIGTTIPTALRAGALALALLVGMFSMGPVAAQDATAPSVTGAAQAVEEETDDGFDWGWLGLLGLIGLAGLMKRPQNEVRTVDRPVDRPIEPRH